ncbi:MAG: 16S rRNA (uracil(1498)-N(3))-methyltransferase [Bacteroidetes bacterium]|nr:16S rRNA (uracil(1498)-N(3))-methyltransferase [Bacteroidota bacterium]
MAESPLFFFPEKLSEGQIASLPEDSARHIAQVLRMEAGERIQLCNGKGMKADCVIIRASKKHVEIRCEQLANIPEPNPMLRLAVAFTKNASRNEWLLEKATELGVRRITPLITERSNRERIRPERRQSILNSAMLQSRQYWLPMLDAATTFEDLIRSEPSSCYLAHCLREWPESFLSGDDSMLKRIPILEALKKGQNACICIGPEGDFSPAELTLASTKGIVPVSLGNHRLRTETAALTAITSFYLLHHASAT